MKLSSNAGSPTRPSLLGPTGSGLVLDTKAVAFPPRSSSFQGHSSGEPTPVVPHHPPLPQATSQNDLQPEYLSAPMSMSNSRSSNLSSSTSDGDTYKGSPQAVSPSEMSSFASATALAPNAAETVPKRTLSQRAKVGSASIAAAVKNLARSRSGSNSYNNNSAHHASQPSTPLPVPPFSPTAGLVAPTSWHYQPGATSPLRETYSPEVRSAAGSNESNQALPPLQASHTTDTIGAATPEPSNASQTSLKNSLDTLPAGAAPLMGRPPSLTASSPPSALPTPDQGLRAPVDNPLFNEPHTIEGMSLVDPDSVFETYHKAEKERGDSAKRRAATD